MLHQNLVLRHPKLQELIELWQKFRDGGNLPLARDIDPADLRPWIGNLLVMDVVEGEDGGFVYSYYGRAFTDAFGEDKVGQSITALPDLQQEILHAEYERVRQERIPVCRVYTAAFNGRVVSWERLVLPLAEDESQTVKKFLVAAYELRDVSPVTTARSATPRQ